jgi:hypothetical protein
MSDQMNLLPCPFCGGTDAFVERLDYSAAYVQCDSRIDEHSACMARGPVGVQDDDGEEIPGAAAAIRAWNEQAARRTAPSAPMGEELPAPAGMIDFMDEFGRLSHKHGYTVEQVQSIVAPYAERIRQLERELAAKQPAQSIDSPEFQALVEAWRNEPYGTRRFLTAWDSLIAYIDGRTAGTAPDARVEDLAMLVRLLVRALSGANPSNRLIQRALDYLKRKGLEGSPLRAAAPSPQQGKEGA